MINPTKKDEVLKAFKQGAVTNKEAAPVAGCSVSYVQQCTVNFPEIYQAKQDAKKAQRGEQCQA
jgi:hypothetical protein